MIRSLPTLLARVVQPLFPQLLWRGEQDAVYLTFDDGPTAAHTPDILDVLARRDVPAAFFLLGRQAKQHPALVRAIADAGHVIGNHSFTHPDPWLTPSSRLIDEYERTTDLLEEQSGVPIDWLRPPYGHYTRATGKWASRSGHQVAMWDVMPSDFQRGVGVDEIVDHLQRYCRPGSVIILHDNQDHPHQPAKALNVLLEVMIEKGYEFGALPAAGSQITSD